MAKEKIVKRLKQKMTGLLVPMLLGLVLSPLVIKNVMDNINYVNIAAQSKFNFLIGSTIEEALMKTRNQYFFNWPISFAEHAPDQSLPQQWFLGKDEKVYQTVVSYLNGVWEKGRIHVETDLNHVIKKIINVG